MFNKFNWQTRVAEFMMRRKLTPVNGSDSPLIVDVERYEGAVSEEGTPFSSGTMNDLENRIESAFNDDSLRIAAVEAAQTAAEGEISEVSDRATALENTTGVHSTDIANLKNDVFDLKGVDIPQPTSSKGTFTRWSAKKYTSFMIINAEFKFTNTGSGWNEVVQMPVGYRPKVHTAGSGFNNTSTARNVQGVYMLSSGNINLIGSFNANDLIDFSIVCVTN